MSIRGLPNSQEGRRSLGYGHDPRNLRVKAEEIAAIKRRFDKTNWIQGGLAALIAVILLFLVLVPSSRAEINTSPIMQGPSSTARPNGTNDSRHAYPTPLEEIPPC